MKRKIAEGKYGVINVLPNDHVEKRCIIDDKKSKNVWKRELHYLRILQPLRVTPHFYRKRWTPKCLLHHAVGSIEMDRWTMDMKQLGEFQRRKHFPLLDVPVYTMKQVVAMVKILLRLQNLVVNTDTKRDNFLWRNGRICLTDFGFSHEFDEEPFKCMVGWPLIYYPREDEKWKQKMKEAHCREGFLQVFRRFPSFVNLWEWEAEMVMSGCRVWKPKHLKNKKKNKKLNWQKGRLCYFHGLGEDILPDDIRQAFIDVNPYIRFSYNREEKEFALANPNNHFTLCRTHVKSN